MPVVYLNHAALHVIDIPYASSSSAYSVLLHAENPQRVKGSGGRCSCTHANLYEQKRWITQRGIHIMLFDGTATVLAEVRECERQQ